MNTLYNSEFRMLLILFYEANSVFLLQRLIIIWSASLNLKPVMRQSKCDSQPESMRLSVYCTIAGSAV